MKKVKFSRKEAALYESAIAGYYETIEKISKIHKTNPSINDINNKIDLYGENISCLIHCVDFWKRVETDIPPGIPARDEAVDFLMRIYYFKDARMVVDKLNEIGLYSENLGKSVGRHEIKSYKDEIEKIKLYEDTSREVVNFIKNNSGMEQSKLRKELSNLDKNALTWVLNRTYFIKKEKKGNKNYIYLVEGWCFNGL